MTHTAQADMGKPVTVEEHRVSCDGGGGVLGHPKVWYEIGATGEVVCEYCGAHFILRHGPADKSH